MRGYTGFKFGEAMPYSSFGSGGSTFTSARPPSYLGGLSDLASSQEWMTQGTAFIQNPQMLEKRAQLEQAGKKRQFEMAAMGDPMEAGRRAYELGKLREEQEKQKLSSQMAFQPQMDAIRGGIMGRMAGRLGINLPQPSQQYSSTPSWMQSYQPPQFPRY